VSAVGQSYARAGLVLSAVVACDQLAKLLVRGSIAQGDSDAVFPGISLVHVRNDGVAFGALSGKPVVLVIVAAALVGLVIWFALHAGRRLVWLPTGLLLGGALGNIVDRARDGAVTDWIKLPLWPAFNLADVAITVGVLALLAAIEASGDAPDDGA
jgi:signal peptidase II